MKKLEDKKREAYFKSLICYINEKEHHIFEGIVKGKITEKIHNGGQKTLPYDRIFVPDGYDKPFCELSIQKKNKISHRSKSVNKFAKWFSSKN